MASCGSSPQLSGADLRRSGWKEAKEVSGKRRRRRIRRVRVSLGENVRNGRRNPAVNPVFPTAVRPSLRWHLFGSRGLSRGHRALTIITLQFAGTTLTPTQLHLPPHSQSQGDGRPNCLQVSSDAPPSGRTKHIVR